MTRPIDREEEDEGSAWWQSPPEQLASRVIETTQALLKAQMVRTTNGFAHARLYGGLSPSLLLGFSTVGFTDASAVDEVAVPRSPLNIVRSVVGTLASMVADEHVGVTFLTSDGSLDDRQSAKDLEAWTDGCFYLSDWERVSIKVVIDALVHGTGVARIGMDSGVPYAHRYLPYEVLVDDMDGRDGYPSQLIHRRLVQRAALCAIYPDLEEQIEQLPRYTQRQSISVGIGDCVEVAEAWHLPSGKDTGDGRHVLCAEGLTLLDEEWEHPAFPFVVLRYEESQTGFWGSGLAELLMPLQGMVNSAVMAARESMDAATFKIAIEAGSKIVQSQINNRIAGVIEYTNKPPTMMETPPVIQQFISTIEWAKGEAFALAGISQMSSQSLKPAGLDSGRALRAYSDIESKRFAAFGAAVKRMHVEAAARFIDAARTSVDDVEVPARVKDRFRKVSWKKIALPPDSYSIRPYPINALAKDPAQRIQTLTEMTQAGWLTPPQAARAVDYPDVQAAIAPFIAMEEFLDWQMSKLLAGESVQPDPVIPLQAQLARAQATYARAATELEPDDKRLAALRIFLEVASAQSQPPAPPPPGAPGPDAGAGPGAPPPVPGGPPGPPAAPMARPQALPVSDLLPMGGPQ